MERGIHRENGPSERGIHRESGPSERGIHRESGPSERPEHTRTEERQECAGRMKRKNEMFCSTDHSIAQLIVLFGHFSSIALYKNI